MDDYKIVTILVLFGIVIVGVSYYHQTKITPIDCNKPFDTIFLKPSEQDQASDIANHINGMVIIPEQNKLIARSDLLLCPNFQASDYVNVGGLIN